MFFSVDRITERIKNFCTPHCLFLTCFTINPITGCWEWNKKLTSNGYGRFTLDGISKYAHESSLELFSYDHDAQGEEILHECDNRRCVSFYHLRIGTIKQNKADVRRKSCLLKVQPPVFPMCSNGENVLREMGGYIKNILLNVTYIPHIPLYHGEVVGLKDVITFQGSSVDELEQAFIDSVEDYLAFCRERGEKPGKNENEPCYEKTLEKKDS